MLQYFFINKGVEMAILSAEYSNLNYEEMAKSIGLKPKHIPMLLASFAEEITGVVTQLDSAVTANDFTAVVSHAHAIKGSAGNLRLNELYEMSKDIELAAKANNSGFDYYGHVNAIKIIMETIVL